MEEQKKTTASEKPVKTEQTVAIDVSGTELNFLKFHKTKKGDTYVALLPGLSINEAGEGSGFHMSIHSKELHFKTTKPKATVKLHNIQELEKSAKEIYGTLIKPPSSHTTTYITVVKQNVDAVKHITPKKTVLNFNLLQTGIVETIVIDSTKNLKDKLFELENKSETKGHLKFIYSDGLYSAYVPFTEEQLLGIKRDILSEESITVILDYKGVIITFTMDVLEQILQHMGIDMTDFDALAKPAFAGVNGSTKLNELGSNIKSSLSSNPKG